MLKSKNREDLPECRWGVVAAFHLILPVVGKQGSLKMDHTIKQVYRWDKCPCDKHKNGSESVHYGDTSIGKQYWIIDNFVGTGHPQHRGLDNTTTQCARSQNIATKLFWKPVV